MSEKTNPLNSKNSTLCPYCLKLVSLLFVEDKEGVLKIEASCDKCNYKESVPLLDSFFSSDSNVLYPSSLNSFCTKHKNALLSGFCQTCGGTEVCRRCILETHQNHKINSFKFYKKKISNIEKQYISAKIAFNYNCSSFDTAEKILQAFKKLKDINESLIKFLDTLFKAFKTYGHCQFKAISNLINNSDFQDIGPNNFVSKISRPLDQFEKGALGELCIINPKNINPIEDENKEASNEEEKPKEIVSLKRLNRKDFYQVKKAYVDKKKRIKFFKDDGSSKVISFEDFTKEAESESFGEEISLYCSQLARYKVENSGVSEPKSSSYWNSQEYVIWNKKKDKDIILTFDGSDLILWDKRDKPPIDQEKKMTKLHLFNKNCLKLLANDVLVGLSNGSDLLYFIDTNYFFIEKEIKIDEISSISNIIELSDSVLVFCKTTFYLINMYSYEVKLVTKDSRIGSFYLGMGISSNEFVIFKETEKKEENEKYVIESWEISDNA